jgi:hydrogenase maturation protease
MEDPLGRLAREAGIVAGGRPSGDLPARPIRIIVLGERHRGDDSVSFAAARRAIVALDGAARELVELRETGQLDPADLVELPAGGAAIVVDAVVGIPPGSIVVLPLERLADLAAGRIERNGREAMPRSSHVLPVDQLVALATALRGDPPPGVLVGIGGARFDVGCDPSPAVAAATDAFAELIAAELASLVEALPGR